MFLSLLVPRRRLDSSVRFAAHMNSPPNLKNNQIDERHVTSYANVVHTHTHICRDHHFSRSKSLRPFVGWILFLFSLCLVFHGLDGENIKGKTLSLSLLVVLCWLKGQSRVIDVGFGDELNSQSRRFDRLRVLDPFVSLTIPSLRLYGPSCAA